MLLEIRLKGEIYYLLTILYSLKSNLYTLLSKLYSLKSPSILPLSLYLSMDERITGGRSPSFSLLPLPPPRWTKVHPRRGLMNRVEGRWKDSFHPFFPLFIGVSGDGWKDGTSF
jgi:hypothetical protein